MKVKQQSFIGGMVGRSGQYSHKTENTFIEGINMIPRRNGILESRPDGTKVALPTLKHDKFLSFRFRGQNYYVVYDTLFKQKLRRADTSTDGFVDKFNKVYHTYYADFIAAAKEVVNSGATDPTDRYYQLFEKLLHNPNLNSPFNYPLRCTDARDIEKAGFGAQEFSSSLRDAIANVDYSGTGATSYDRELIAMEATRLLREYLGFGFTFSDQYRSGGRNQALPYINFDKNQRYTNGTPADSPRHFDSDPTLGTGLGVFQHDVEQSTNWYCRFLIFDKALRLHSYQVRRPYFLEHDSEEKIVDGKSIADITNRDEVVDGVTQRYAEEISRDVYGDTPLEYRAEVSDNEVVFINKEGKLPPLVFTPPGDEEKFGKVHDMRCYYGLPGYDQNSYIPEIADGKTAEITDSQGDVVEVRPLLSPALMTRGTGFHPSNNFKVIANSINSLDSYYLLPNPEPEDLDGALYIRTAETLLGYNDVRTGADHSYYGNLPTDPGSTRRELRTYNNSPYASYESTVGRDLSPDNPLKRILAPVDASSEPGTLNTFCNENLFSLKTSGESVSDDASFNSYIESTVFNQQGVVVFQKAEVGRLGNDRYRMVDFFFGGDRRNYRERLTGERIKTYIEQWNIIARAVRTANNNAAALAALLNPVTNVGFTTFNDFLEDLPANPSAALIFAAVNRVYSRMVTDLFITPHGYVPPYANLGYGFITEGPSDSKDIRPYRTSSNEASDMAFLLANSFYAYHPANAGTSGGGFATGGAGRYTTFSTHQFNHITQMTSERVSVGANERNYFNISSYGVNGRFVFAENFVKKNTIIFSQLRGNFLFDQLLPVVPSTISPLLLGGIFAATTINGAEVAWMTFLDNQFTVGLTQGKLTGNILARSAAPIFTDESVSRVAPPIRCHNAIYQIGDSRKHVYRVERSLELSRNEYISASNPILTDYLQNDPIDRMVAVQNEGYLILLTESKRLFLGIVYSGGHVGWTRLRFGDDEIRGVEVLDGVLNVAFLSEGIVVLRTMDLTAEGGDEVESELEITSPYRLGMDHEATSPLDNTTNLTVRGGKMIGSFSKPVGIGTTETKKEMCTPTLRDGTVGSIIDIPSTSLLEHPHTQGTRFFFKGKTRVYSLFYEVK